MKQIERALMQIVENTFGEKYTDFEIKWYNYIDHESHGMYVLEFKLILIYNLYRKPKEILLVVLHEVAHAIQHQGAKYTDHGHQFYKILLKLLIEGIKLNLFTIEDFKNVRDTGDAIKIHEMFGLPKNVQKYPENHKSDFYFIFIKDFDKEYNLEEDDYEYNEVLKVWEKETTNPKQEMLLLKEHEENYKYRICNLWDLNHQAVTTITVKDENVNGKSKALEAEGYQLKNNDFIKHIAASKTRSELVKLKLKGIKGNII